MSEARSIGDSAWDAEYWKYMALTSRRLWFNGWDWRIYLGGDEFFRRTIVVGPACIALWRTREAREEARSCEREMDRIKKAEGWAA